MEIKISNCPQSGMVRKVTKQLQKLESVSEITLECKINYYNASGDRVNTKGIHQYTHRLTAHNRIYVNPFSMGADAGKKWSKEQSETYDLTMKLIADYPAKLQKYQATLAAYQALENPVGDPPAAPDLPPPEPTLHPMGQFDFFMALSKMDVNIDALEIKEVMEADSAGKFNI